MDLQTKSSFQVFIQSPHLTTSNRTQTPTLTLTLTLNDNEPIQTLHDLKLSLLSPTPTPPILSSFFFSLNGKPLPSSTPITPSTIPPSSILTLQFKLLGGGGDGGSTCAESRDCYLNMYAEKKPDKADPNERRLSKWTTCALSYEPLSPPCVVDRLGNLFNKETLVKALLGKTLPKAFRHIKGLKDMVTVHLDLIPGLDAATSEARFQCPISGLEFNGKYRFFALRKCGHVLSAKALKEVKSCSCLVCHTEFVDDDKIVVNATEEEVEAMRVKIEAEKAAAASLKEKKKAKKGRSGVEVVGLNNVEESVGNLEDGSGTRLSGKKHGIVVDSSSTIPSGKLEVNGKVAASAAAPQAKRFKALDVAPPNANKKVYASIFTSSSKSNFKETYSCRSLPLGRN